MSEANPLRSRKRTENTAEASPEDRMAENVAKPMAVTTPGSQRNPVSKELSLPLDTECKPQCTDVKGKRS